MASAARLLSSVIEYLPSPAEVGDVRGRDPADRDGVPTIVRKVGEAEPLAAFAFKVQYDDAGAQLTFVRVYTGTLRAGDTVLNATKGNLEQMPDFAAYDPSNLLLGQWNGKFAEAGDEAGIACNAKGRGALIADFNLDGRLDILQINRGSNALLWRNMGAKNGDGPPLPMGNWSEIRLIEPNPNRNAVGARITIRTGTRSQTRFVDVGGGAASGHAGFIHVGLGTAERAEIRVQWPDGDQSPSYRVFANQFVVVDRTKPQAAYWYPGR